jgi:hypothetical protein
MDAELTQRRLLRIWLPTALGASVLVAEIPVVYAAVARATGGAQALAAIGICLSLLVIVNTPALALAPLVAVEAQRRGLRRYALGVGVLGAAVLLFLGVTPPALEALRVVFGLDADLLGQVSDGLVALAPNSLGVALRRDLHGRFIHAGRTGSIITATAVRIVGTGALAWVAVAIWPQRGALAGGLALSAGALLETAMLAVAARALPTLSDGRDLGLVGLMGRHIHLSSTRLLAMAPMMITMVGIAHSQQARASLVVWPALYELLMLFSSPTTDWAAVSARALRRCRSSPVPRRLTVWLCGGFSVAFIAVVATGVAEGYLRWLVAVPPDPTALALRWIPVLLVVPAAWIVRAYLQGVLIAIGATAALVRASAAHVLVLGATVAVLAATALPGVGAASIAVVAGLLADLAITARYVTSHHSDPTA